MFYVYYSHKGFGEAYVTTRKLEREERLCDLCNDMDVLVGEFPTREEAEAFKKQYNQEQIEEEQKMLSLC